MQTDSQFAIIGAGVAGLAAAIGLQKQALSFQLFEQAPHIKGIGAGFGLAANAMQALTHLGISDEVEKLGQHLNSYQIRDQYGHILVAPKTDTISHNYKQGNFAIHRADLHRFLLSQVYPTHIQLGKRAIRVQQHENCVTIHFADGSLHVSKYLLVADGVKSPIRQQLVPSSAARYAGYTCWRATINNSAIQLQTGSETWGKLGRFGMTPLVQDRIYWYACVNAKENDQKYKNYTISDLLNHFGSYHAPIPQILAQTKDEDLLWNDIVDIVPLKHLAYGNILLLGDAGHATTPNLGQGACQALEDVAVLMEELETKKEVSLAFVSFEKRRLARTKYIINTSRSIGEIAQWDNATLIATRNTILKILPDWISQAKLHKLLSVNFMTLNKN